MSAALSNTASVRRKVVAKSFRDFEAIGKQIVRFGKMTPENFMRHFRANPSDHFCSLPHPEGKGSIFCGHIAWKKFDNLANTLIEYAPELDKRVDLDNVRKIIRETYVRRILHDKILLNSNSTEDILSEVTEKLKGSLGTTQHLYSCVLFYNGSPDEFQVGPVIFTRSPIFIRKNRLKIRSSVEESIASHIEKSIEHQARNHKSTNPQEIEIHARKYVRGLYAQALKTYRSYPWVAQVEIKKCDKVTSDVCAARTIDAALHVIRILLGARNAERIRLARSRGDALRTADMWIDESGILGVRISSRSIGPVGFSNWHDGLMQIDGYELNLLGSAISVLANPQTVFHLHQRVLDGIHWFGDAATEPEFTSQIIKYTSGIERLIFGKFKKGQKMRFANRLKAVCKAFGCDTDDKVHGDALEVYKTRSALLHGDYSPRHDNVRLIASKAENLCRLCILCLIQLYPAILAKFNDVDSEHLESIMDDITEDADKALMKCGVFV
ncbi:MAG: hypothetical protein C4516_04955 [Oxalobacter sp.]|nr:MAG: hypothetical protein C4516_04955 [Oxalobacter sp.]